ncbi:S41 family peptidase [Aureispira anguillae]|uniref:S41 family peptidase n=1 Tax=Aureispira anguillae TaxID=2864201 RepID=A0A915YD89_9BACT|nr:S41 family peptidase [Aureispira anguillae]BDS10933.1 S41 family peptidase [Aureispira anguillae]
MKKTTLSITILILLSIISCKKNDRTISNLTEQQNVFKEFWDIYDKHYPLFHRKNINWQSSYNTYYNQITTNTTDDQLFEIFNTIMTKVIKDGHTDIIYNNNRESIYMPSFNENVFTMVKNNTASKVNIVPSSANNPYISYGTLVSNSNIGYINSKSFEPINENESEFNNFKVIVDEALTALQGKVGIILDIRTNGGGQPHYAYYLAGRFLTTSTPIELIRQRIKTTTGSGVEALGNWATEFFEGYQDLRAEGGYIAGIFPELNTINKSGNFQFTNKVALLTSNGTASAAEHFTAALKTQNHVITIGDKTFGIFAGSDILTLTNGNKKWKTRVSTHDVEVIYNGSFQSFEGIGITPDSLLIPSSTQISAGEDIHLISAINYIN